MIIIIIHRPPGNFLYCPSLLETFLSKSKTPDAIFVPWKYMDYYHGKSMHTMGISDSP
jgi:hypothetical protein